MPRPRLNSLRKNGISSALLHTCNIIACVESVWQPTYPRHQTDFAADHATSQGGSFAPYPVAAFQGGAHAGEVEVVAVVGDAIHRDQLQTVTGVGLFLGMAVPSRHQNLVYTWQLS